MQIKNLEVKHAEKVLSNGEIAEAHNLEECCNFIRALVDKYRNMCNENHPLLGVNRKLKEIKRAFQTRLDRLN